MQAPNFALAAPVLALTLCGCWSWMSRQLHKPRGRLKGYWAGTTGPYVLHWGLSAAVAAAVMNIQVSTRLALSDILPCSVCLNAQPSTFAASEVARVLYLFQCFCSVVGIEGVCMQVPEHLPIAVLVCCVCGSWT